MAFFTEHLNQWIESGEGLPLFPGLAGDERFATENKRAFLYSGKVRQLIQAPLASQVDLIHSDRLTAFDREIAMVPTKGILLTQINAWWMQKIKDENLLPSAFESSPHPRVIRARKCLPLKIEVVVRGFLAGSLLRQYQNGERNLYDIKLPDGLMPGSAFKHPIITPTTKEAAFEHDQPTTPRELILKGIIDRTLWDKVQEYSLLLFNFGQRILSERGLAMIDTKYEFGILEGTDTLALIDEIHTPDSSRFCVLPRSKNGSMPLNNHRDKEVIRQWLARNNFTGEGSPPKPDRKILGQLLEIYNDFLSKLRGHGLTQQEIEASSVDKFLLLI